jgi:hypothetical protein
VAASQPRPSDSFVERFSVLVRGSQKRRVDLELRILDVVFASFFLLIAQNADAVVFLGDQQLAAVCAKAAVTREGDAAAPRAQEIHIRECSGLPT